MVSAAILPGAVTLPGLSLQVRAVSHHFVTEGKRLDVLDRVTFSVERGSFTALVGPSGCGKSTLLRLIAGLEPPSGGKIGADNVRVVGPDPSRLLVFQDPTLFPWRNVRQNVALGLEARGLLPRERRRIDDALRLVGLDGFAGAFPNELSGGMAQRVALARVLVNDPRLLLLDEPLGKLDSLTRMAMQTELLRLWQDRGFTGLLVTHDVEEALLLSRTVIVFSARPARIVETLSVDLPYPRHRDDPTLVSLRRALLAKMNLAKDL
ncbi:MAG TPA: ABC transporter ATP-binding protein [Polyangiaceae bacterium]|nr:ABC transporter ATP-binding protein [Polyangiaceae bacterium]